MKLCSWVCCMVSGVLSRRLFQGFRNGKHLKFGLWRAVVHTTRGVSTNIYLDYRCEYNRNKYIRFSEMTANCDLKITHIVIYLGESAVASKTVNKCLRRGESYYPTYDGWC